MNTGTQEHQRNSPIEIDLEEFRRLGKQLIDQIADHIQTLPQGKVTAGKSPDEIRSLLGNRSLPETGTPPEQLLQDAARLLFHNSLYNGHPKFFGYITSSPSPIGALADLLASAINQNLGSFSLSPMATEIEAQTIRWIAELIGYRTDCGGILVSGGNMANFVGFLAARRARQVNDIRKEGAGNTMRVYASAETHTWIKKAVDMFGMGTDSIRWIQTDNQQRMNVSHLEESIISDKRKGLTPAIVIGSAGTVSTGAVDPLPEIARISKNFSLWFHVDGAYGAPAAALPEASTDLKGLQFADSVAVDPHKWLYAPLEVGCTLVRNSEDLLKTFQFDVPYYRFGGTGDSKPTNYYEYGPQNSRGFRALKVWLALQHVGKSGYCTMIREDIRLAEIMFEEMDRYSEIERFTQSLSIVTFRFIPEDLRNELAGNEEYINRLNSELLARLQKDGEVYLSNAMFNGTFLLRACIVNFRTTLNDVKEIPKIIVRVGRETDNTLRTKRPHF